MSRLQAVQNSCAKVLTSTRNFDSATEARKTLHWLPVKERAKFKILLFAHKIVHNPSSIPQYLSSPFSTKTHSRTTRYNLSNTLSSNHSFKLATVGGRSIFILICTLWNSLPSSIRDVSSFISFKGQLKTQLFNDCYG